MEIQFDYLLHQYRQIWNHRLLVANLSSEEILYEAILRELKDENSHPRVRRTIYEKFFLALQRLQRSSIPDAAKAQLIAIHIDMMEKISE